MADTSGTYLFCGIGGSGMSALAQLVQHGGARVWGSDRSRDQGVTPEKFAALERAGFRLFPQDGSGVRAGAELLVVSTAVEESVPDVREALRLGIAIRKRAELLADQFARFDTRVAVGGTSGKSTVTAMVGHILATAGREPTVVNGAVARGEDGDAGPLANVRLGGSGLCVIEADESDGSIQLYRPTHAVLTNISLDHQPLPALRTLFRDFLARASSGAVVNLDCAESRALLTDTRSSPTTFSVSDPQADVLLTPLPPTPQGARFRLGDEEFSLQVPGRHNVANAAAAVAVAMQLGVPPGRAARALQSFAGVRRRLETVGTNAAVTVIDDFAHNPDKIAASLAALHEAAGRLLVIYQPHGFGPTRLMRDGLIDAFGQQLAHADELLLLPIFYAGGAATRDISSDDLAAGIAERKRRARCVTSRDEALNFVRTQARSGDRIVVMGARDDSLTTFARRILAGIGKEVVA